MTDKNIKPDEAQDALEAVEKMKNAGLRRAVTPRWYGIGISLIVATGFGLYALEEPGNLPGLFIALGLALFASSSRTKIGAIGKELPDTSIGLWAMAGVCIFLLTLFFGGIIVRRAYDLAWVPLITGLIAGSTLFLLAEMERRYYIAKADEGSR